MIRMPLLPCPWLVPLTSAGSLHSTCSWISPNFSHVSRSPLPEHSKYPSLTGHVGSISLPALAPRPICAHLERSLPLNSTVASEGGAYGVAPGVTTEIGRASC